jgi:hypothetical protein
MRTTRKQSGSAASGSSNAFTCTIDKENGRATSERVVEWSDMVAEARTHQLERVRIHIGSLPFSVLASCVLEKIHVVLCACVCWCVSERVRSST